MKQMQTFGNSQAALQALSQQHPEINSIFAITKKGASLKQIAEIMAQQKGINLNNLIQELQS